MDEERFERLIEGYRSLFGIKWELYALYARASFGLGDEKVVEALSSNPTTEGEIIEAIFASGKLFKLHGVKPFALIGKNSRNIIC